MMFGNVLFIVDFNISLFDIMINVQTHEIIHCSGAILLTVCKQDFICLWNRELETSLAFWSGYACLHEPTNPQTPPPHHQEKNNNKRKQESRLYLPLNDFLISTHFKSG